MREQGISLKMSSFSSEIFGKTIAYKKQKEEDRSMRKQGISLVMSSFSSEIEDYSIQEATPPHSSFLPSLSPFNLLLSLFLLF